MINNKKRALFIKPHHTACDAYRAIWTATSGPEINTRFLIHNYWNEFYPFADRDFELEFQRKLDDRFWEMYVTVLMKSQFKVDSFARGPDVIITTEDGSTVFVEAVVTERGQPGNPNTVPEQVVVPVDYLGETNTQDLPEDQIIMRLTNALSNKLRAFTGYLNNNLVKAEDPCVIALNSCPIQWMGEVDAERMLKALFPIGDEYFKVDRASGMITGPAFQYRNRIPKSNGEFVYVDNFLNDDYSIISGVLYSRTDCANIRERHGSELIYIHNPKARNPLPNGFFNIGVEYTNSVNEHGACELQMVQL